MSDDMKQAKVRLAGGVLCEIEVRGHRFVADEPEDKGGEDRGPTPMELFLAGLASCTAMTLRMYADLKKWPLDGVTVEIDHAWVTREEWADWPEGDDRDRLPRIRRKIRVEGDLDDAQLERLRYIANRCPVHRTVTEDPVVVDDLAPAD